jgi:hypothetical protein
MFHRSPAQRRMVVTEGSTGDAGCFGSAQPLASVKLGDPDTAGVVGRVALVREGGAAPRRRPSRQRRAEFASRASRVRILPRKCRDHPVQRL